MFDLIPLAMKLQLHLEFQSDLLIELIHISNMLVEDIKDILKQSNNACVIDLDTFEGNSSLFIKSCVTITDQMSSSGSESVS